MTETASTLRARTKRANVTMTELARVAGYDASTVRRVFDGLSVAHMPQVLIDLGEALERIEAKRRGAVR